MLELARFLDSLISEFTPKDKKGRNHSIENLQVSVLCVTLMTYSRLCENAK